MSGHSHWATTHRQKGLNDAKRAAIFTKAGRNIILAAERGGGNPDTNYLLKIAIAEAKALNMPKDRIERAIKRGTGELVEGARIEEILYEGFGPGNVALIVSTATDNKNRTVSELKSLFTKNGGKLGAPGSAMFQFRHVGMVVFSLETYPQDKLETETLDSGADDFLIENNSFVVVTKPEALQKVQAYFQSKNLLPERASLGYVPTQTIGLEGTLLEHYLKLRELVEDHADVQAFWDNLA